RFENGEIGNAILLGDAGYPVKNYLLTPLAQVNGRGKKLYNEAQIRTRNPMERSHGVWIRRWPVLSNGTNLKLPKVQWVIVATAVVHNIAIGGNEGDPPQLTRDEEEAFNIANNIPVDNAV